MRIATITLAASLALALTGSAWSQGVPGGNGTGGNVAGGSTTPSSAAEPGNVPGNTTGSVGAGARGGGNPAGVIDGTNPNPDAGRAGGIRSPERAGAAGGAAVGR